MSGWRKRTIMEMAKEAEFELDCVSLEWHKRIEAFAALVREDECEACAKLLENTADDARNVDPDGFVWQAVKKSAELIRARGQA
jgi:hypothetical protein